MRKYELDALGAIMEILKGMNWDASARTNKAMDRVVVIFKKAKR
jgi:hypothetical protein